ncbi:MAG: D-alanyl-D-alanine dipeptidase [Alphaproteobacteria bacterium]|nr:D-alanyl-D-alanine dipeptidase [Alphaproteobacteria bacterium]MBV8548341.1 D-alanyl-D-alanine dipeptidase [Alphaproteobacteria bacterium]
MKPYSAIPIQPVPDPMEPIPTPLFTLTDPHFYVALGAPYGNESPWMLRRGVIEALKRAQARLQAQHTGWRIKFHDAYRPNRVQQFMVDREYAIRAAEAGLDPSHITPEQREQLAPLVLPFWAIPSDNPATPPPHSTGAAMDITLVDEQGREVDMGTKVDETTEASAPDYFANATDEAGQAAHRNRALLYDIMHAEGFHRHKLEWWHFSRGDQLWAWLERELNPGCNAIAIYGNAGLTTPASP